jgi:rubrerythrin
MDTQGLKYIAKFRCLKCGHKWEDKTGPTQCPKCWHLYVKWENYEELRKIWNKNGCVC